MSTKKPLNILAYVALVILVLVLFDYFLEVAIDGWNNPFLKKNT